MEIQERQGKWLLRLPGHIFPVLEATPEEVVRYIKAHYTSRGIVEVRRENGIVEKISVSALTAL